MENWKWYIGVVLLVFFLSFLWNPVGETHAKTDHANETVRIYTDSGTVLAEYEGASVRGYGDGYIRLEYEGNCYTYINCYIEWIEDMR